MSILDPLSCGFLKAFCYKTFTATPQNLRGNRIKQQTGAILMQQYESFQNVFQSIIFMFRIVNSNTFVRLQNLYSP